MIKDYRLPCSQRQAQDADAQARNVYNSKLWMIQRQGFVAVENCTVENEDDGDDLATEVRHVAVHEKPIRFLD